MELLRDRRKDFEAAGGPALAVSRGSPWTHLAWMQVRLLHFGLRSDRDAEAGRGSCAARARAGTEEPGGRRLGVPYGPLEAAFGRVWAWNLFVLLTVVAAGWLACLWLRELGLGRLPAALGGLAFEAAPYRAAQSAGHLIGPISILLPLTLWAFQRGRRVSRCWLLLACPALASIPLSRP